ncbi:hypothetical protein CLV40_1144 [Actinokineospora auranticolor]|uniref:Uncharacterized protein n=1 Tax=Actinokineospora auranticolor TaxID=155976 RepID=A0A2S6GJE0_9PSEU|nr:hypothetical protein CLV40_1144 [Actinokineospora auranticolor]
MPLADVQRGLDLLWSRGRVRVTPAVLGHRSSFVGTLLGMLPNVVVERDPVVEVVLRGGVFGWMRRLREYSAFDRAAEVGRRVGEADLRGLLLQGADSGRCGLCGELLPGSMLMPAFIKPRAECEEDELGELGNLSVLFCALGCDRLFDRGLVAVGPEGTVVVAEVAEGRLQDSLHELRGRRCVVYRPRNEKYFVWHRQNRFVG